MTEQKKSFENSLHMKSTGIWLCFLFLTPASSLTSLCVNSRQIPSHFTAGKQNHNSYIWNFTLIFPMGQSQVCCVTFEWINAAFRSAGYQTLLLTYYYIFQRITLLKSLELNQCTAKVIQKQNVTQGYSSAAITSCYSFCQIWNY